MSPKAAECDYLIPRRDARHSEVRWIIIEVFPKSQWCEAGLHPCTNLVYDILLPAAFLCLRFIFRRCVCVPRFEDWWQAVQAGPSAEILFADDAALISYTEEGLQRRIVQLAQACTEFALIISLKKTNVMGQEVSEAPAISIDDYTLEVVQEFTYLGSTITSNLSLNVDINKRIGKAAFVMSRLSKRVWENNTITENTKVRVYQACVLSTLL